MTPREKQFRREQRADALRAFIIIWCMLVAIVGLLWGLMVWAGI